MAVKHPGRTRASVWRQCDGKVAFAKRPIDRIHRAQAKGIYLRDYECPICERFHLSSKPALYD